MIVNSFFLLSGRSASGGADGRTVLVRFLLESAVELAQQVTGPSLQIRPREVELQVVDEASQAAVVRRLPEVFRVLIQPGAQDRGDGAAHETRQKTSKTHSYQSQCVFEISDT